MSQRLYLYPLLFAVLAQLITVWRLGGRWYGAQIVRFVILLLVSTAGMYFSDDFGWVLVAWGLFAVFVIVPQLLARAAMGLQMVRPANEVARWWWLAGWCTGGNLRRVYHTYAAASKLWSGGHRIDAENLIRELAARPMPESVREEIRAWQLSLLVGSRDFPAAVAFYEHGHDSGVSSSGTPTRLLAARAYAETGEFERALWCLQLVALSSRTVGPLETRFWATRVCVAALAGDQGGLESLLRSGGKQFGRRRLFERVAANWRGRCALVLGDRAGAIRQLARARELTPPRNKLWRDVIARNLQQAEALPYTVVVAPVSDAGRAGVPPDVEASVSDAGTAGSPPVAALSPGYAAGQQAVRLADQQSAEWRALMCLGSPGGVTLTLLAVLACVYFTDVILFDGFLHRPLLVWAGNIPEAVRRGEWWRPTTAIFLHANPLHLGMNGLALWLFGSAVEKSMGRWRYLAIFFLAGSLGNLLSAMTSTYDVSVGASGGIFGVIAAFAAATVHLDSPLYASLRRRLLMLLALMVTADFTISGLEPQVDTLAHAGGFVAGLVLALLLHPRKKHSVG
jgi:rhomboid protease GluP